jgi:hypothetical protein
MTTTHKWIGGITIFFIGSLVFLLLGGLDQTLEGLFYIWTHPSVLVTDYLHVGGLFASLLNMWIIVFASISLLGLTKTKLNGLHIAGLFTIAGFAFFGKTLLNALPIWIGIYSYGRIHQKSQGSLLGAYFFGTAIGPIVSYVWFASPIALMYQIILGIVIGVLTGYLIPMIAGQASKLHQGYNLYNIGFTIGIIASIFTIGFRFLDWDLQVGSPISTQYTDLFLFGFLFLFIVMIIAAFLLKPSQTNVVTLHQDHGVKADFYVTYGLSTTLLNMGILGLLSLLYIVIFGLDIHGPKIAAILTLVGFGAYGKHVFNSLPVMIGAFLFTLLPNIELSAVGPSIAILFVTALAPVTLKFGVITALIAGFIHVFLGPYGLTLQGGFALYNNGFVAGFVATGVVVVHQGVQKLRTRRS